MTRYDIFFYYLIQFDNLSDLILFIEVNFIPHDDKMLEGIMTSSVAFLSCYVVGKVTESKEDSFKSNFCVI